MSTLQSHPQTPASSVDTTVGGRRTISAASHAALEWLWVMPWVSRSVESGHRNRERSAQRGHALDYALSCRIDNRVGARILSFPFGQNGLEVFHRLRMTAHRAQVALCNDSGHVLAWRGFDPNGEAIAKQKLIGISLR